MSPEHEFTYVDVKSYISKNMMYLVTALMFVSLYGVRMAFLYVPRAADIPTFVYMLSCMGTLYLGLDTLRKIQFTRAMLPIHYQEIIPQKAIPYKFVLTALAASISISFIYSIDGEKSTVTTGFYIASIMVTWFAAVQHTRTTFLYNRAVFDFLDKKRIAGTLLKGQDPDNK